MNNSKITFISACSAFHQQNVIALIEGSHTKTSACALSTVTGIPLIHLHGDRTPLDQCEKAVQMSVGYRDYAHASLDILNSFQWKKTALVYDGKMFSLFVLWNETFQFYLLFMFVLFFIVF